MSFREKTGIAVAGFFLSQGHLCMLPNTRLHLSHFFIGLQVYIRAEFIVCGVFYIC